MYGIIVLWMSLVEMVVDCFTVISRWLQDCHWSMTYTLQLSGVVAHVMGSSKTDRGSLQLQWILNRLQCIVGSCNMQKFSPKTTEGPRPSPNGFTGRLWKSLEYWSSSHETVAWLSVWHCCRNKMVEICRHFHMHFLSGIVFLFWFILHWTEGCS